MAVEFEYKEFNEFQEKLLKIAKEKFPRESKNFMGRAGNKLRSNVKKAYITRVRKKTGNLLKGISRGRPYLYQKDQFQVRVKNKAPHAHLIEHGHVMKDKDGTPIKRNGKEIFVEGKHIVGEVYRNFEPQFAEMTDEFVDDLLKGGKVLL